MDFKQMCVQQGYVPPTCTMEGQMCWLLVQSQGDPCKGCHENRSICNGRHAPYEDKTYGLMCFIDKMDEADRKRNRDANKRRQDIIDKRKEGHLDGYTHTILEIKAERDRNYYIELIVKDLVNEKAYVTRCETIEDAVSICPKICKKYEVEQIHIEEDGYGRYIYDRIFKKNSDIDIVPLRYMRMKSFE